MSCILPGSVQEGLEVGQEPIVGGLEVFGDGPNVGENGDEIMIARPAGDDMVMQMVGDPCAGIGTDVAADIQAVRAEMSFHDDDGVLHRGHQRRIFGGGEFGDAADMAARRDEEVAVGIGEAVEQNQRPLVSKKQEEILVGRAGKIRLEEAAIGLRGPAEDMLDSPGGPEGFHNRMVKRLGRLARLRVTVTGCFCLQRQSDGHQRGAERPAFACWQAL